jgi:hypothetical protein
MMDAAPIGWAPMPEGLSTTVMLKARATTAASVIANAKRRPRR